jgi:hypothetical protein
VSSDALARGEALGLADVVAVSRARAVALVLEALRHAVPRLRHLRRLRLCTRSRYYLVPSERKKKKTGFSASTTQHVSSSIPEAMRRIRATRKTDVTMRREVVGAIFFF